MQRVPECALFRKTQGRVKDAIRVAICIDSDYSAALRDCYTLGFRSWLNGSGFYLTAEGQTAATMSVIRFEGSCLRIRVPLGTMALPLSDDGTVDAARFILREGWSWMVGGISSILVWFV